MVGDGQLLQHQINHNFFLKEGNMKHLPLFLRRWLRGRKYTSQLNRPSFLQPADRLYILAAISKSLDERYGADSRSWRENLVESLHKGIQEIATGEGIPWKEARQKLLTEE